MIIDTHMHEKTYSSDSFLSLEDIVKKSKSMGLDGVCITDHESNEIKDFAHQFSKQSGFLILVGAEVLTHEGDITVFGLDDLPKEKIHAQQLIDLTLKTGGVAISAHPFRHNNRGMGKFIKNVQGLSGIEAFNGSTFPHHNLYAYGLSSELSIPALGASDAHTIDAIGKYATLIPGNIRDEKDFIEAVKSGRVSPVVYSNNKYESLDINQMLYNKPIYKEAI
ncbi:MAG: hypothetical protein PWR23_234 [Peptostreptococcaceae bacterium]|nr:hypothetical protein [Peptostreptococcaceae bacterium]